MDFYIRCNEKPDDYFDNYDGEVFRFVTLTELPPCQSTKVLITRCKTPNKDIDLLNLYWKNKRMFGVRYLVDNITVYSTHHLLVRFKMEFLDG